MAENLKITLILIDTEENWARAYASRERARARDEHKVSFVLSPLQDTRKTWKQQRFTRCEHMERPKIMFYDLRPEETKDRVVFTYNLKTMFHMSKMKRTGCVFVNTFRSTLDWRTFSNKIIRPISCFISILYIFFIFLWLSKGRLLLHHTN